MQPARQDFDPFEAGDSEAPEASSAPRRAAVPGGRYTGARTAMPEGGPRSRSAARAAEAERPVDEAAPAPRRAAQPGPRPAQPGRRPRAPVRARARSSRASSLRLRASAPRSRADGPRSAPRSSAPRRRSRASGLFK